MSQFFKIFFASLLALVVFTFLALFIIIRLIGGIAAKEKPGVNKGSVLVIDLSQQYQEQMQENPLSFFSGDNEKDIPGLYDVVRLIRHAKTDKDIEGIYLLANISPNGFAASDEIRNALLDFKQGGKFILAYGDRMTQSAYSIANVADKVYIGQQGMLEWVGFNVQLAFVKGTLEKLEIQPQIFYAGKFKSATEPLRSDRMSEENKLQTTVWMNDLYNDFLQKTSRARGIDTAALRRLANEGQIKTAHDAVRNKLADAVKYDDEVKDEIKTRLKLDKYERISFISINAYLPAVRYIKTSGDKIALIYAEGNIVEGRGGNNIAGEDFRSLIRRARLDKSIKAIVFRVNSGGGSSLASEQIWRELSLAKKEKPVIVSFGDVAASGGYYIACGADSIFAQPTTITGSIGVFGIIPNMEGFFKNKLGVSFDGVSTGPYADMMSFTRPMNENEKTIIQESIDTIYTVFKQRVADARKRDTAYIDSIAQGRVWTGFRAKDIGLVDRFGGLDDAIKSAAAKAQLTDYQVREYPEKQGLFAQLFGESSPMNHLQLLKKELGEKNYRIYLEMQRIKEITGSIQARLPFEFFIQ